MPASHTATGAPHANHSARSTDDEILGLPAATRATAAARVKTPRDVPSRAASNSPAVGASAAERARTTATPSEGLSSTGAKRAAAHESPSQPAAPTSSSDDGAPVDAQAEAGRSAAAAVTAEEPENYRAIFDANPDLRDAWHSAQAYREIFPDIEQARALQKIFPTSADAERATAQLAELEHLDSMFFSNRPESLAELAAAVYRLNPGAFTNLARVMAGMVGNLASSAGRNESSDALPARGGAALAPLAPAPGNAPHGPGGTTPNNIVADAGARHAAPDSGATTVPPESAVERATPFEDTNAATVEGVVQIIESQVDRLLPEGISSGARNRVVGEVYRALDADHQRAIVGMIVGRARQALPGVAKKVVEEWTSTVLAASGARLARQRAAERRVDIAGAGPAASEVRRPLTPSDVDYAKLSDADILNL